jgi:hypothetical protein
MDTTGFHSKRMVESEYGAVVLDAVIGSMGVMAAMCTIPFLESFFGVGLYARSMMASAVIFFAPLKGPPHCQSFLYGTFMSGTLGVLIYNLFEVGGMHVPVSAGIATGILLLWYKLTNSMFPPAAALCALIVENNRYSSRTTLQGIVDYIFFPWLAGHLWLYVVATMLGVLRQRVQSFMTDSRSLQIHGLREIFDRFDTSHDQKLEVEELRIAIRVATGVRISLEAAETLVSKYNCGGTRVLDFEEFVAVMSNIRST